MGALDKLFGLISPTYEKATTREEDMTNLYNQLSTDNEEQSIEKQLEIQNNREFVEDSIPIGSVNSETTRGVAITDDSRNPSVLNEQIYTPDLNEETKLDFSGLKNNLDTVAVAPTPEQIADANTPRLGDKIDLIKKRESVGDTNYLQKGETKKPKKAVEDKQNNNIINYDSGLIYNKDTNIYSSSDPRMNALISVESSGKHTIKDKINVPGGDVTDLSKARGITQLKPTSFSDLKNLKKYARNFKKSYSVDEIDNPETNYIIGEQYLKSLFKDFKNLGYSEDDAQDLGYIAYNQGYQAVVDWLSGKSKLKKEGQEYIGKINKVLGIDRGIKNRNEYKKIQQKQSGGMIESDPYKREPRFI